jgi:flagellar basal-body rod modification protein FlgD
MVATVQAATDTLFSSASSSQSGELDKNAFLNLLITQLRYQDPTNPVNDREFIAQLAQFSSLEQASLTNQSLLLLAQMNSTSQALGLIGKKISAVLSASGETVSGLVDSVKLDNGQAWLLVGDKLISPAEVVAVES